MPVLLVRDTALQPPTWWQGLFPPIISENRLDPASVHCERFCSIFHLPFAHMHIVASEPISPKQIHQHHLHVCIQSWPDVPLVMSAWKEQLQQNLPAEDI